MQFETNCIKPFIPSSRQSNKFNSREHPPHENLFDGGAEDVNARTHVARLLGEIGVHEIPEDVALAYSDGRLAALRHLAEHHAEICDRGLDGFLQLLQVPASILDP